MGLFGGIKNAARSVYKIGKRAYGAVKSIGKQVYGTGRKVANTLGAVGEFASNISPILGLVPGIGGSLAAGANIAGNIGKGLAHIGNSTLDKAHDEYDKGESIYNAIKGEASRQGLLNGSSGVSGMNTTPPTWSSKHESRSNAQMKLQKQPPVAVKPSGPIAPVDVADVKAPGANIASGPMSGMSSEFAGDTVAVAERSKRKRQETENQDRNMSERLQDLKAKKAKTVTGS